jgi:DNA mismatch repair protein MutL
MDLGGTMRLPPGGQRPSDDGSALRLTPTAAPDPQRQREMQLELAEWAKDQLQNWQPPAEEDEESPETDTRPLASPSPLRAGAQETVAEADSFGPDSSAGDFDRSFVTPASDGMSSVRHAGPAREGFSPSATASLGVLETLAEAEQWREEAAEPDPFGDPAGVEAPTRATPQALPAAPASVTGTSPHVSPAGRVMQIHDCYLLLETQDGLTVIDQHALHERILYEQLRRRVLNGSVEAQKLLVPQTLELTPPEVIALLEHVDVLRQLGFALEDFGGTTLLLSSYPTMMRRADHTRLIRDIAEKLLEAGRTPTRRDLIDHLLHTMACRGAIKAGQRLTPEEMDALLAQRSLVEDSHHCPHGRPTSLVLSRDELDRQFGRLGPVN